MKADSYHIPLRLYLPGQPTIREEVMHAHLVEQLQFNEVWRGNGVEKGKELVDENTALLFVAAGTVDECVGKFKTRPSFGCMIPLICPRGPDLQGSIR